MWGVDNDGDKSLVVVDSTIVKVALNNMRGVVPLYYEMAKAGASRIDNAAIYGGIVAAYTGGNIGAISNDISKIWDSETPDVECVKILCMENNYTIDYAKCLYKPTRPHDVDVKIRSATKRKLPHFFMYAKDKDESQVCPTNRNTVNRLFGIIPNTKMSFKFKDVGTFNYHMLKRNVKIDAFIDSRITLCYDELEKKWRYKAMTEEFNESQNDIKYKMIKEMMCFGYLKTEICDILIDYLFKIKKTKNKSVFWALFGDIVYANLRNNGIWMCNWCSECGSWFPPEYEGDELCSKCRESKKRPEIRICAYCGMAFEVSHGNQKYCSSECQKKSEYKAIEKQVKTCIDCGCEFIADSMDRKSIRCAECRTKHIREYDRIRKSLK